MKSVATRATTKAVKIEDLAITHCRKAENLSTAATFKLCVCIIITYCMLYLAELTIAVVLFCNYSAVVLRGCSHA